MISVVKKNEILSENSRSSIKFTTGIRVLMAKQYIDNLAEKSAKWLNERIAQGYALYPPLGYIYGNDGTHKHAIIKDPERANYAVRAFNLFVYGNMSAPSINNILYEEGLRNPKGEKYALSTIQRMFKNPMYVGDYIYQGKIYPNGKHEALISREIKTCKKNPYINETKIEKFILEILNGLEKLPQELINDIKGSLKEIHDLKNNYSTTSQDIYK